MITLAGVNRLYQSDAVETTALRDIELNVTAGEFVAVMGPSGSGKSTLLNVLGLIDRPTEGQHLFLSHKVSDMSERDRAALRRDKLGFIFQSFNLIDELTVAENIELGLTYRKDSPKNRKALVADAMDRVGVGHRAKHHPHQLSGGQQQRAAIARAIVGEPALLLADEPTGNLDTANGAQVMDILKSLNQEGATIVMVTHSASQADQAKRVVNMLDGRIVASARRAV
ncbi:ABC transporter ATP-binding protein [Caulobacter sp.]|uniref:ABC transporter ATP-binding protein n=1 Tax=Caulobacter sp. TaxID=78 RepID=UPI001B04A7C2|nr:ABC transporter ATP-binding protein [Caulobacter sp.]MBO9546996.1 ABC transporter ATP-binding protein [Caulobacter sp.]